METNHDGGSGHCWRQETVLVRVSRFVPTFGYEFNDENAPSPLPPVSFPYGAAHSTEVQYLFDLPGRLSGPRLQLAGVTQRYWTGFAARAVPSSIGTPFWPPFNGTGLVQSLAPSRPGPETNFAAAHQCAFWNTIG